MRKSQITPERKQRKKDFLTPFALHRNIQTARKSFIYGLFRNLVRYSNSTHGRLITMILIAFSLLSIVLFAIFSVLILTGIKIVLKLYSRQHNKTYSSISGILINSCSFFCNTALSGNCSLYSATIIGDRVLLIAYSTTSSSLEAQRIIPTLGFSFSFFF